MEKIIFFGLVIPIMAYVLYLGGMAIMNGFNAKEANRAEKETVSAETVSFSALFASLALNPFIIAIPPKYRT